MPRNSSQTQSQGHRCKFMQMKRKLSYDRGKFVIETIIYSFLVVEERKSQMTRQKF